MRLRWYNMLFLIAIITLYAGTIFATEKNQKTIAVVYFENNSIFQKEELASLSKGLADMFITEMSKIEELKVIERAQLQKLLEEMQLGQAGMLDQSTAQQVGKLLGAQTLLLGSFLNMPGDKLRIDARIVEVETGVTIKAEEETGKMKKLFEMVQKLTKKIAEDLNVSLTKADKQRIEDLENESFDAALYYSKGLEYHDNSDYKNAYEMYKKALEINPDYTSAKKRIAEIKEVLLNKKKK